jgi:hypothetical protein
MVVQTETPAKSNSKNENYSSLSYNNQLNLKLELHCLFGFTSKDYLYHFNTALATFWTFVNQICLMFNLRIVAPVCCLVALQKATLELLGTI